MKRIEREAREIGVGLSIAAKAVGPLLDRAGVKLILTVASDLG
jgi:N-carbamoyl-L-amino-acid hydrolase